MRLQPLFAVAALCAAMAGCQRSSPPAPAATAPPAQLAPSFDLGAVMRQVHFAYRAEGPDAFRAAHSTYEVRVADGALSFTPLSLAHQARTAVAFQPARIRRGERTLALRGAASITSRGGLELLRGEVVEQLQNGEHGVEQSWRLERPLEGEGDLELVIPVSAPFIGETAGGLHFGAGELMVRYGHATFIDALGRTTAIPARYEAGAIALRVPTQTLAEAAYPAVLDPIIGAELGMDTPVEGPAALGQTRPAVAFGGGNYFVVWADGRAGDAQLFGTRVSPAGAVLDPAGVQLAPAPVATPRIAFNGSNFLVAWEASGDIHARRVSPAGALLESSPLVLGNDLRGEDEPDVASDGTNFFVVWVRDNVPLGSTSDPRIVGRQVTAAGAVSAATNVISGRYSSTSFSCPNFNYNQCPNWPGWDSDGSPTIAGGNGRYLVAWSRYDGYVGYRSHTDIYGTRFTVNSAGSVWHANGSTSYPYDEPYAVDSPQGTYAVNQYTPAAAYSATHDNFLVVYDEYNTYYYTSGLYGRHVHPSLATSYLLETSPFSLPGSTDRPDVASNGTDYYVTTTQSLNSNGWRIHGRRVSGAVSAAPALDSTALLIAAGNGTTHLVDHPAVASDGTGYFGVWQDGRNAGSADDVYGARVDGAGALLDPAGILLASSANAQREPTAAFDGTNHLVVWEDTRGSSRDIYGVRVDRSGAVLDPSGIAISTAAGDQLTPSVAWSGSQYLVVWSDYRSSTYSANVWGTRVGANGAVLDPSGLQLGTNGNQRMPKLVWNGGAYFLAWYGGCGANYGLCGLLLSPSASPLDAGAFSPLAAGTNRIALATNGTEPLVVWETSSAPTDVLGVRFSSAGIFDSAAIPIATGSHAEQAPAVASNGTDYLVAWQDGRRADAGLDIYGTPIVGLVPTVDGGTLLGAGPGAQVSPSVGWSGTQYVLAWRDDRNDRGGDIFVNYADATGVVADPAGVSASATSASERSPSVVPGLTGRTLLVYTSDLRTRGRFIVESNGAPTVSPVSVATSEDTPVSLTVTGVDPDSDPLSFRFGNPANGTVTANGATVTYTPNADFNGTDSFTYSAFDGVALGTSTVTVTVSAVNDAPRANAQSVNALQNTGKAITLTASDVEGGPLTYAVTTPPTKGSLTGTPPNLIYTSSGAYLGADSFAFTASDGALTSAPATVSITVIPPNRPPVASAQTQTTPEDTARSITLAATDPDGDPIAYAIVGQPANGVLSGTPPALSYLPNPNYSGTDSFTFSATDPDGLSSTATVSLDVTAVNDAPVADAQTVTTAEDTAAAVVLTGSDVEGSTLTFTVLTQPASGSLSGTAPNLTWTPALNYAGTTSFTFRVSDGSAQSSAATVTLTATPVNDAPTATPQSVSTNEDTQLAITLGSTDPEGGAQTYAVTTQPAQGTLSGTPPNLIYTPNGNYAGADSFEFTATDSSAATSAPGTIGITVLPVNDAPTANPQSVSTAEDTPLALTLTGTDPEGATLSYSVVTGPTKGALTGAGASLTYTPGANESGADSFVFRVSDGTLTADATVSLTITAVNDGPSATAQSVTVPHDTATSITLSGTDPDGDTLTYAIVTQPGNGSLSGSGATLVYTPTTGYSGPDSFTFTATDPSSVTSAAATVSLTVSPANQAPVANAQSATTAEDTAVSITLAGSDADGDPLTFAIATQPANGTVTLSGATAVFTPSANYAGQDSFTFTAYDGSATSAAATVSVTVTAVNDAPVAAAQSVTTAEDTALPITLGGADPDDVTLTYSVVTPPTRGTLSGSGGTLTYTPGANYAGADSFVFRASDGSLADDDTVSITVTAVNDAPVAAAQSVVVPFETATTVTLSGSDVEGDALTFAVAAQPAHGTLTGSGAARVYTPASGYTGPDSFTFTATDPSSATSAPATVTLTVSPGNRAPVAAAQSVSTAEDTAKAVTLAATDADGDPLTYAIAAQPANGTVTLSGATATYTPAANFNGTDSFAFTASDGQATSAAATVDLTVTAVNDAPVASLQNVATTVNTPKAITLAGSDVEGSPLTFAVATAPANGTLSGTAPNLIYTPNAAYAGADGFTFTVSDGALTSPPAVVGINVTFVNSAPVASSTTETTEEDTPRAITLVATDADSETLTFTIEQPPGHGTLTGTGPALTYTPAADYHGSDSLRFVATDGAGAAASATVSLTVTPVNDVPVAKGASAETTGGVAVTLTLGATDADGDALSYAVVRQPAGGTLSGEGASRTYLPRADFAGEDVFTFTASDGSASSPEAEVKIQVAASPDVAAKGCGCASAATLAPLWVGLLLLRLVRRRRAPRAVRRET